MMSEPLLRVDGLTVEYNIEDGKVTALEDVSLVLERGESLGIVGESGCGKSTLAQAIMGILPENARVISGSIMLEGQDVLRMPDSVLRDLRWKKMSMIFQGSMNALNPVYRVGSTLVDVAKFKSGLSKNDAKATIARLYEMVGMNPLWMNNYPHQYSGGMKQRAVIAMSMICNPALIIADEPTTALDVVVQAQILKRLTELMKELGISILLISHDVEVIGEVCERVAVMYGGKVFEIGSREDLLTHPNNPYTRALLTCFPDIQDPKRKLKGIPGEPPDLTTIAEGCRFAPRCSYVTELCREKRPPMFEVKRGHRSYCHFAKDLLSRHVALN
jgi:peptide/nickel transport system ATP-binding protein